MTMILYGYWRSSAAYRARIALNLKGIDYEQRSLVLRAGEQRHPDYLKLNPQARVPTLIDGTIVLTQSQAIVEYLEERHREPQLLPNDIAQRARVRALAAAVACDIHPANNLMILEYLRDPLNLREDNIQRWYEHWVATGLRGLEGLLAENPNTGRYCHGDSPTMADAFLVPQVHNARRYDCPLDQFPTIVRIDAACGELEAFDNARPENQPDAE